MILLKTNNIDIMKAIHFLLFAGILGMAVGCGNKNAADEEEALPKVNVKTVYMGDVNQLMVYTATIEANVVNNIAPQTSGRIKEINVEVGDFVKEGDVLAQIDRANLEQAELQMKNNEIEYERLKSLYEVGGLSKSDLDAMELSYNVSKTTYENLLENTVLTSPITGVISARNYDVSDMYSMGSPIYVVEQIVPVKLYIGLSEGDYTKIKKGDTVELSVEAFPGRTFTGKVNRLDPTLDAATHTFKAEILVTNTDRALRPGMFARVTVSLGFNNSPIIPDMSVNKQLGSGEKYVYVLNDDNTVSYQPVVLGYRMGSEYEVLSGVKDGDKVVYNGQTQIKDGVTVDPTFD